MRRKLIYLTLLLGLLRAPSASWAQESETDAAIKRLEIKAKMFPGDYKSYAGLGAAYLQKGRETGDAGNYELAKGALNKSLALLSNDPAAAFAMTQMAVACMAEHRFEDAWNWAQKALAAGSGDPSAWAIAGDALADVGDYQGAADAYSRLSGTYGSEDEQQAIAYQRESRMSYLRFIAGDTQDAINLMHNAIDTATHMHMPAENIAWSDYQLGEEYFQAGDLAQAESAYRASLTLYPGYYRGLAGLAKVRNAAGDPHQAVELYTKAIAVVPYPEYAAALGDVYLSLGETAKAEQQYQLVEFIGYLGAINQQIHNRDLALFYADHGKKPEQAVALARKELELRQDVYTWDALAWTLSKHGREEEAAEAMAHAMSQGTQDALLFFHDGMIHLQLGDPAKARDLLLHALTINPHFHPVYAEKARKTLAEIDRSPVAPNATEARNAQ